MESNNNNTLNELEKINQNIKGEKSNIPIIIAVIVFIVAAICIYLFFSEIAYMRSQMTEYYSTLSELSYCFIWLIYDALMAAGCVLIGIQFIRKVKIDLLSIGALAVASASIPPFFYEMHSLTKYTNKFDISMWMLEYLMLAVAWGLYGVLKLMKREDLMKNLKFVVLAAAALSFLFSFIGEFHNYNTLSYADSFIQCYGFAYLVKDLALLAAMVLIVLFVENTISQPAASGIAEAAAVPAEKASEAVETEPAAQPTAEAELNEDRVKELIDYKKLLDDGIISAEEFESIRKNYLGF